MAAFENRLEAKRIKAEHKNKKIYINRPEHHQIPARAYHLGNNAITYANMARYITRPQPQEPSQRPAYQKECSPQNSTQRRNMTQSPRKDIDFLQLEQLSSNLKTQTAILLEVL